MASNNFYHPDYEVGCGGTEVPTEWGGKKFLYVWNKKTLRHEYYVTPDDLFISDTDAPWMHKPISGDCAECGMAHSFFFGATFHKEGCSKA
jgi:hypothetical protein